MARLTSANAAIRLTIPEAFEVHRRVIEWRSRFSPDRIPDQAVGLDPFTTRLMEWTLQKWQRVTFLNRYLAGTLMPRLQLDVIPRCAAPLISSSSPKIRRKASTTTCRPAAPCSASGSPPPSKACTYNRK